MLVKELQALALDVTVFDDEGNEIDLKQDYDDTGDEGFVNEADYVPEEEFTTVNDISDSDGYYGEDEDGNAMGLLVDESDDEYDYESAGTFMPDDFGDDNY